MQERKRAHTLGWGWGRGIVLEGEQEMGGEETLQATRISGSGSPPSASPSLTHIPTLLPTK